MSKFGFECIDTADCGKTKCTVVFCTTHVRHTLASLVMYCAIVTFPPFTTLRLWRGLIVRFVQLARGSSLRWWRKRCYMTFRSVQLGWTHTCFVMYCTIVTFAPLWPFRSPLCVRVGDLSCGLCNLSEGALPLSWTEQQLRQWYFGARTSSQDTAYPRRLLRIMGRNLIPTSSISFH